MTILLIGSGGREHALARLLRASGSVTRIYCTPGNPGIANHADLLTLDVTDHDAVVHFCQTASVDLVVIGPEQPLADGLSDTLRINSITVFGPSKAAAMLETSKGFAKDFMQRHAIPTAAYMKFSSDELDDAKEYIVRHSLPVVVKADGLAAGKGVVVAESHIQAITAIRDMFEGEFGSAGASIVVEQFLRGEEASVFAICDGSDFTCLAPAQDHKRALDGDKGKNTGGMGSYAPAPVVTADVLEKVKSRIIRPLLDGMQRENMPFVGCLFVGLMIENGEPSVVEFNARFGDPETQSVLAILDADLAELFHSAANGTLNTSSIRSVALGTACTVVLASDGYPDRYEKGFPVSGLEEASHIAFVHHAGTVMKNGELCTNGGRVFGVTAVAETLSKAVTACYSACSHITYANKMNRTDIGKKGLLKSPTVAVE
ncbi:MAG: phosphoribosylamine--glycine ligase [Candidatus Kapabacteria bacterium]|nr:phosphoribosylamine--glycine ligase [Candidatus Kapabacteria bacterium]